MLGKSDTPARVVRLFFADHTETDYRIPWACVIIGKIRVPGGVDVVLAVDEGLWRAHQSKLLAGELGLEEVRHSPS